MEYRTLENTDSVCIYEAFTQAFSDYQVSVDMPFKSFETMLKRNGFMPAVSVGAFADRTLVGFILNGVRDWDNEKTVYDLGTGVIPDFRRTGIMGELLNLVRTICIKNKISVYQLEVIQDNEKALTLYKKQGFRINRILNCYQLTGKIKEPGVYKVWKLEHPEKLQEDVVKHKANLGLAYDGDADRLIAVDGKTQKMLFVQSLNPFPIRLLNLMET